MSSRIVSIVLCWLVVAPLLWRNESGSAVFAQSSKSDREMTGESVKAIQSISVQKGSDALAIDIQTNGTCAFKQYEFKNPNRLVIDIYGAVNRVKRSTLPVDYLAVRAVRISQYKLNDPMITRVVLDLEEQPGLANAFQVKAQEKQIRVTLDSARLVNAALDSRLASAHKRPAERKPKPEDEEIVLPVNNLAAGRSALDNTNRPERAGPSPEAFAPATLAATFPAQASATNTPLEQREPAAPIPAPAVAAVEPRGPAEPVSLAGAFPAKSPETADTAASALNKDASVSHAWTHGETVQVATAVATHMSPPQSLDTTPESRRADKEPAPTPEGPKSEPPAKETAAVGAAKAETEAPAPKAKPAQEAKDAPSPAREESIPATPAGPIPTADTKAAPVPPEAAAKAEPVNAVTESKPASATSEAPVKMEPTPLALESKEGKTVSTSGTLAKAEPATAVPETKATTPPASAKLEPPRATPAKKTADALSQPTPVVPAGTQVTFSPAPLSRTMVLKPALAAALSAPQVKMDNEGGGNPAAKAPAAEMPRYTGEPISLDFKDGDLVDFFRLLSQITGLNIVLDPSIKGTVSIKMTNVPYDQVFDVVLENNELEKKIQGNVVRVARKETLRREEDERRKLKEAQMLAADTVTETVKLKYANAEAIAKTLTKHLSSKGEIVVDPRTNTLIVKDIPDPVLSIKKLVYTIDTAEPQVEIEARIVSASRDFARDIGVQLGFVEGNLQRSTIGGPNTFGTIGGTRPSASPGDTTYVGSNPFTGRGQPSGQTTSGGVSTGIGNNTAGNYIVNMPAQPPNRLFGFGYSLGNIFDKFLLDASITAGEQRGLAKLISQPKVTVQNNTKANITQGLRFPVQVIQNNTVTVQFFDAALRLEVTPQITDAGTVLLELAVQNNVADFARQVNGIPSIRTSESKTRVLVGDGGTTVIAGILVDNENRVEQKAPVLANVPVVGNLFKRRFNERNTQEVLFFITPRIRKEGF